MNRLPPGTDPAQADRVFAAFKHLQSTLTAARPDALVVVGTDHFMTFNYDAVPTFAIGTGDFFQSWGEASSPDRRFRGHDPLSIEVVEGLIAAR
jgi:uracil-DNA glycosylase